MTQPIQPTQKILVFDSGVGGLSILDAIQNHLPEHNYVFACDNAGFPYGTKTEDELLHRVDATLQALVHREQPDIIVVACNTASTLVLPRIRSRFSLPIVGVVPAIKPAAEISKSRVIGLLGTPGTVERTYTQQLIAEFAADCEVIKVGSSELVIMAEEALRGSLPDYELLGKILAPLFKHPALDTVVLACTHFPLISEALSQAAPKRVRWLDSGDAIARRVATILYSTETNLSINRAMLHSDSGRFYSIFTSDDSKHQLEQLHPTLSEMGCTDIRYLSKGS